MATRAANARTAPARGLIPEAWGVALRRVAGAVVGVGLILLVAAMLIALLGYDAADPSLGTASGRAPVNPLGLPGAWVADLALTVFGFATAALLVAPLVAGARLVRGRGVARWQAMAVLTLGGDALLAVCFGVLGNASGLPAGPGGGIGLLAAKALAALPPLAGVALAGPLAAALGVIAVALLIWGSGVERSDLAALARLLKRVPPAPAAPGDAPSRPLRARPEPLVAAAGLDLAAAPRATIVTDARLAPPPSKRAVKDRQPSLDLRDRYALPSLALLKPPPKGPAIKIDAAALEQNARLLESVLDDFGVKGRIGEVRPGPVVTMYELEPAPGIKASRVIGLADDIARSMSALSARVAVVAGRNVIGIELPNQRREMVVLSELLGSAAFDDASSALPLVLGKNIAGDPVIADLSPMPHLLIAGTTGSGKSVGLNCMILSLLYRA